MSAHFARPDSLDALDDCGIRLDFSGMVVDWADRPGRHGRSFEQDQEEGNHRRNPFTAKEDLTIREWCYAAEQEGVRGTAVFEQLESLYPRHTWRAYEGRWRKILQPQTMSSSSAEIPLTGVDTVASLHQVDLAELDPARKADLINVNYADQRIETARVILEKLSLNSDDELLRLLQLPWIIRAYVELADLSLAPRRSADEAIVAAGGALPRASSGRSQHIWKIDRTMNILQSAGEKSWYLKSDIDMSSWTDDDFDLRFLVRLVQSGVLHGHYWYQLNRTSGLRTVCEQALWLLLWFRWLWKLSTGDSAETYRLQMKKEEWLSRLQDVRLRQGLPQTSTTHVFPRSDEMIHSPYVLPTLTTPSFSQTTTETIKGISRAAGQEDVEDTDNCSTSSSDLWYDAVSSIAPRHSEHEKENESVLAKLVVEQATPWLSDEIYQIYLNNRDGRLAAWGVSPVYSGTCMLVPADWAYIEPTSLMTDSLSWPRDETKRERLCLSLGADRPTWARAVAWFEGWPRSYTDYLDFGNPDGTLPQGSHLCHHSLCILPAHIVYESRDKNLSRNSCSSHARILRMYQAQIPPHCIKHNPPCLMQLAALTAFEAFSIQFSVLRQAFGLPNGASVLRPTDHPRFYETFEWQLPTSSAFSSIHPDPKHLKSSPASLNKQLNSRFRRRCCFCIYARVWGTLTAYWSHLRTEHSDKPSNEVLGEVTAAAEAYQQWAHYRFYNLERSNPTTWAKIVQAKQVDFNWEIFSSWRLHKDRLYGGRCTRD